MSIRAVVSQDGRELVLYNDAGYGDEVTLSLSRLGDLDIGVLHGSNGAETVFVPEDAADVLLAIQSWIESLQNSFPKTLDSPPAVR